MKTVYTDRFGIFHWAMIAVALWQALSAFESAMEGSWGRALLNAAVAGAFSFLAARRMIERRAAIRAGSDPAIMQTAKK
ncbi:hypothetical protein ACFCW2_05140 [Qipengyuania sp. DSG2-2]|uniref:hypothetical protein n=1 Tax=Qipengyuania sp. DGS2-2 TaxID=3349631 RepID=UPI0036D22F4E